MLDDFENILKKNFCLFSNYEDFSFEGSAEYAGVPFGLEAGLAYRLFPGFALNFKTLFNTGLMSADGYLDVDLTELMLTIGGAWTF